MFRVIMSTIIVCVAAWVYVAAVLVFFYYTPGPKDPGRCLSSHLEERNIQVIMGRQLNPKAVIMEVCDQWEHPENHRS